MALWFAIFSFNALPKEPYHFLIHYRHHLLSTYMVFRSLWKRQCNSGKEGSVWLYTWVIRVSIKMFEIFVKQIGHSYREETLALGKTVPTRNVE